MPGSVIEDESAENVVVIGTGSLAKVGLRGQAYGWSVLNVSTVHHPPGRSQNQSPVQFHFPVVLACFRFNGNHVLPYRCLGGGASRKHDFADLHCHYVISCIPRLVNLPYANATYPASIAAATDQRSSGG